ncbi:lactonase family protein [Dyadobacter sp. CY347]|uniref:lactonase family protein n=1 Tax=Dyadobacter sp. CY347 TaxID=2909336 RepID=UPI001F176B7D|nr:lactonase family protein [Dyadobacter sp. CY347]MCF2487921.1 lactonase family protein [Dyadobacter sp. CY347]
MTFAQKSGKEILYIGTYTQKGEGIYVYEFDRSNLSFKELQVMVNKNSPSFLEFHPNKKFLYSANEGNSTVSSYAIDAEGKLTTLNSKPSLGKGPCHVSVDPKGRFLYISNYGSGQLGVYLINSDGTIGAVADSIQDKGAASQKPHMHSVIPSADGKYIYASDLGIDKIMVYSVDPKTGKLTPGAVPYAEVKAGDGPRHFAIHPSGNFGYSACELGSAVNSFKIVKNSGALVPMERVTMLPADFTGKSFAADIHFSPDGKFLYASNRGHESLAIYAVDAKTGKLTTAGHAETHGKHPRNFLVDAKGELVMVTNRDNDNVVFFKRNAQTGQLTYTSKEISIPTPVCVKQLFIN